MRLNIEIDTGKKFVSGNALAQMLCDMSGALVCSGGDITAWLTHPSSAWSIDPKYNIKINIDSTHAPETHSETA